MKSAIFILLLTSSALAADVPPDVPPPVPVVVKETVFPSPVVQQMLSISVPVTSPGALNIETGKTSSTVLLSVQAVPITSPSALVPAVFSEDVYGWYSVWDFLNPTPKTNGKKFSASWIDSAREKLRQKIAKEGYSPEALSEAQSLMWESYSPPPLPNLKKLKTHP